MGFFHTLKIILLSLISAIIFWMTGIAAAQSLPYPTVDYVAVTLALFFWTVFYFSFVLSTNIFGNIGEIKKFWKITWAVNVFGMFLCGLIAYCFSFPAYSESVVHFGFASAFLPLTGAICLYYFNAIITGTNDGAFWRNIKDPVLVSLPVFAVSVLIPAIFRHFPALHIIATVIFLMICAAIMIIGTVKYGSWNARRELYMEECHKMEEEIKAKIQNEQRANKPIQRKQGTFGSGSPLESAMKDHLSHGYDDDDDDDKREFGCIDCVYYNPSATWYADHYCAYFQERLGDDPYSAFNRNYMSNYNCPGYRKKK